MLQTRRSRQERVKVARNSKNILKDCPELETYLVGDQQLAVDFYTVNQMSESLKKSLLDLLEENMKEFYGSTPSGWDRLEKSVEMFDSNSRHVVLSKDGEPVAFSHFQFDMDYGVDVIYCYELQILETWRRKGIGRFIVRILEHLRSIFHLTKLILTVFNVNLAAIEFYKEGLGFSVDETSPESQHYIILSRTNAHL